jgi:hypothetical protein
MGVVPPIAELRAKPQAVIAGFAGHVRVRLEFRLVVAEERLAVPGVTRAIVRRAGPSIELSSAPGPGAEDQRLRVIIHGIGGRALSYEPHSPAGTDVRHRLPTIRFGLLAVSLTMSAGLLP